MDALKKSLNEQGVQLSIAELERSAFLARNEKRLSVLLVLTLFNAFALATGAISLFDAYCGKARHRANALNSPGALKT
jgi:hypothetical protein